MSYLIASVETHAVLFLGQDDRWTEIPAMARRFSEHRTAERTRHRVGGSDVITEAMAPWLRAPVVRVEYGLVVR